MSCPEHRKSVVSQTAQRLPTSQTCLSAHLLCNSHGTHTIQLSRHQHTQTCHDFLPKHHILQVQVYDSTTARDATLQAAQQQHQQQQWRRQRSVQRASTRLIPHVPTFIRRLKARGRSPPWSDQCPVHFCLPDQRLVLGPQCDDPLRNRNAQGETPCCPTHSSPALPHHHAPACPSCR